MSKTPSQTVLVVLTLFLLLPPAAAAQEEKPSGPQPSDSHNAKAVKTPGKLPLKSVTVVDTTEAVRKVAEEESARKEASKAASKTGKHEGKKAVADTAVLEFHPTEGTAAADSSKGTFQVRDPLGN